MADTPGHEFQAETTQILSQLQRAITFSPLSSINRSLDSSDVFLKAAFCAKRLACQPLLGAARHGTQEGPAQGPCFEEAPGPDGGGSLGSSRGWPLLQRSPRIQARATLILSSVGTAPYAGHPILGNTI